jgi:hypothetical protein
VHDEPHDGELDLREGCDLGGFYNGIADGDALQSEDAGHGPGLSFEDYEANQAAAREAEREALALRREIDALRGANMMVTVVGPDGFWRVPAA